ncbi:MAG: S-layer homology domain-containing protein [Oscillospiraceae bacterium]|nr:S-layer homology domain-containing protein [Oscillospiraceae bacterium]
MGHKARWVRIRALAAAVCAALALSCVGGSAPSAAPSGNDAAVYRGIAQAEGMLRNISYTDVGGLSESVRQAIYQAGALSIIDRQNPSVAFEPQRAMTRMQALSVCLAAGGYSAEAQMAGEALNAARPPAQRKAEAVAVWEDGYAKIAGDLRILTKEELDDALLADQTAVREGGFLRDASVSKQELARYLAISLGLAPYYGRDMVISSFSDLRRIKPEYAPYVEAVVRERIMRGTAGGAFGADNAIAFSQAAVVLKNAEALILSRNGWKAHTGIVGSVTNARSAVGGGYVSSRSVSVTDGFGDLHRLTSRTVTGSGGGALSEETGEGEPYRDNDYVVYKNQKAGLSETLREGDRISFIVGAAGEVLFVSVISNVNDTRYLAAKLNFVDAQAGEMGVSPYFRLDLPDLSLVGGSVDFGSTFAENVHQTYAYDPKVQVTIDGAGAGVHALRAGMNLILTISGNKVVAARTFEDGLNREYGVVTGIVEENNTALGYITLYNANGGSEDWDRPYRLRTYTYSRTDGFEVLRNYYRGDMGDVLAGDTAFIKLGKDGSILGVSAVDNYVSRYGEVKSVSRSEIVIGFEGGFQQIFPLTPDILVVSEKCVVDAGALRDGDRVKVLLQRTEAYDAIREITIEGSRHHVTSVYKGTVLSGEKVSGRIVTQNLRRLVKGDWTLTDQKGVTDLRMAESCRIYADGRLVSLETVNKYYVRREAYMAVERDYGGEERIVMVSFRGRLETEDYVYDGEVRNLSAGGGEFGMSRLDHKVGFDESSIIVKDNRLVLGSSIRNGDVAYVVANMSHATMGYMAGVIEIGGRTGDVPFQIYRGRVSAINVARSVTLASFSQYVEPRWEFANTPKTFTITDRTRVVTDEGVVSVRDFRGFGPDSYLNSTVYVISNDVEALLISTAPYGAFNLRGVLAAPEGGAAAAGQGDGASFLLREATRYLPVDRVWVAVRDVEVTVGLGCVIIRNGAVATPDELEPGDRILALRGDETDESALYVVIVEG